MAKKKEGSGLQSSAGLMRYYDAEETAISVTPKSVIIFSVIVGVAVLVLNFSYGYWPIIGR
jgi:preprotein translocase subunit Sec61beta